jgi:hypothetical protein
VSIAESTFDCNVTVGRRLANCHLCRTVLFLAVCPTLWYGRCVRFRCLCH